MSILTGDSVARSTESPSRIIAVLGMHRSGTSCLTGSLQDVGLNLGDCHTWNPYNKKGNRENQAFVDLHDKILASNGGSWDQPPKKVVWHDSHYAQARGLLANQDPGGVFGFKDPRALMVIDGWKQAVPSLELVGVFRHPEAVVKSLANRSNLSRNHALDLWLQYNQALLRVHDQQPFPILCFDENESEFQRKVAELARRISLTREAQTANFYDRSLKHHRDESLTNLPDSVNQLYMSLRKASM